MTFYEANPVAEQPPKLPGHRELEQDRRQRNHKSKVLLSKADRRLDASEQVGEEVRRTLEIYLEREQRKRGV